MPNLTRQEAIRLNLAVVHDRGICLILERHAPSTTVCPTCDEGEFTHEAGCELAERIEEIAEWLDDPYHKGERPAELGTLVYVTS